LKSTWDEQVGATHFEQLCQRFQHGSPSFIAELRKKRDHYLAFLKYPDAIRRSLCTTNTLEAINGQLEIIRRNSGGYFQSEETLKETRHDHYLAGKWSLVENQRPPRSGFASAQSHV